MLLLEFQRITKVNATKWKGKSLTEVPSGFAYFQSAFSNQKSNPQYGTIEIKTKLLQGEIGEFSELYIINHEVTKVQVNSIKKGLFGDYKLELEFKYVFAGGLKAMTQEFFSKKNLLIAISDEDKVELESITGQKKLLELLANYIIPGRISEIMELAMPCYGLVENSLSTNKKSFFLGESPLEPYPKTKAGDDLIHLGKICLDDYKKYFNVDTKNHLSFYSHINNGEEELSLTKDEFMVYHHQENESSLNPNNSTGNRIYFDAKPYLDIPGYDHSIILNMNLSEEEQDKYDSLESTYLELVYPKGVDLFSSRLFGYPRNPDNCPAREAERISNQLDYNKVSLLQASGWKLLLQINMDEEIDSNWKFANDAYIGILFYMIKQNDFDNGNFENIQLVIGYSWD